MCKIYLLTIVFFWCFAEDTAAETNKNNLILKQAGDNVTLTCKYQPRSNPNDYLDIEWTVRSKIFNESDKMIITLSGGRVYVYGLHEKMTFASGNGSHGDASLFIKSLAAADSGIYDCKVKIQGIIHQEAWNLTVQGKEQRMEDQDVTTAAKNNTMAPTNSTMSPDVAEITKEHPGLGLEDGCE
ncbi:coxsackievirus and adenovirus receptor homolog [Pristis pectinata]|uniref:coxsackievirus and adenovirus receptor homolog n=1 Tax=Pristis pectinata TaxID=685728 RepID=UPI00223DD9B1|nr:coxsackievirus and adenovirus receptor homolog [Pristis pectinata]